MKKLLLILIIPITLFGQSKDPNKILEAVKEKFEAVEDYEVDATITVDVNFLRVPESKTKIYFKQPDKIKLDSEGFALLPKEGINFAPTKLLNANFSSIFVKSDTLQNHNVDVIKVIPLSDSATIILTTLWVDSEMSVVRKMETTTKRNGTFEINLSYEESSYNFLPSEIRLTFSVKEIQIPKAISGELNNNENEETARKRKKNEPMTGTVIVKYSNYKINQGLKDSFFEKEKR